MNKLSIVLPTCNRAELLRECIESIRCGTRCSYELIVVDGASTYATAQVLSEARQTLGRRLRIIREESREGFVRAANKGLAACGAKHITWLNDDARIVPGSLDNAVRQMDAQGRDTGLLAMFHRANAARNIAYETVRRGEVFRILHLCGTLYADFGLGPRRLFEELGGFDERFFIGGAVPDFSIRLWQGGRRVLPAYASIINHCEHNDERRAADAQRAVADNEKLLAKWDLPPRIAGVNDFDPTSPCTLRGLRAAAAAKAA